MAGRIAPWMLGVAVAVTAAAEASAQSNLDAGKSPAQIFSDTCNACHRSPRELKQTSPGFLREHYTTGGREAAAMAAYLTSVGSDARAVQQRRPPALGAGKEKETPATETASKPATPVPPGTVPPGADQAKPPETQAALPPATPGRRNPTDPAKPSPGQGAAPAAAVASVAAVKPRRPSESMEAGRLSALPAGGGGSETVAPQAVVAPSARPAAVEDFEE